MMEPTTVGEERSRHLQSNQGPQRTSEAAEQPRARAGTGPYLTNPPMDSAPNGVASGDRHSASATQAAELLEHGMSGMPALLAMIGISLAILLAALDQTIVGTALPRIVAEL